MNDGELVKSPVVFNEFEHSYTHHGITLSGVTSLLSRTLFRDKYLGVDFTTLEEARQRGTLIHEQIELYESIGAESESSRETIQVYKNLKDEAFSNVTISHITTEYLVSDNNSVASMIDLVYEYKTSNQVREFCLIDIKTTSQLDTKYLQWQLSIYAYLFELQNPDCKVVDLCGLWIPKPQYGKPKIVDISRVPDHEVEGLLTADLNNEDFVPESEYDTFEFESPYIDLDRLIDLREQKEQIDNEIREMTELIKYEMESNRRFSLRHTSTRNFHTIGISFRQENERISIDTKKLKDKYPEVYNEVVKTNKVKSSLSMKSL